jgi:hypothetical protein
VVRTTKALAGLDVDAAPLLLGYVVTRLKPTSEPILASENGDPLLTWWRYGLGMSVAFTSDAKSRWAAEWLAWPNYGKFWAQVVRHAMRKSESKGVVVQVDQKDRSASVTLDAIDPSGRFLNDADTVMTVIDDQNGKRTLEMAQTAPGRYSASFPTPLTGAYHTEFSQKVGGQVVYQQSRGLAVGYPEELRLRPTNNELLKSVARVSGGVYDPPADSIFAPNDKVALQATPLWPYLLIAAALVFVLDVALRRIDFTLIGGRRRSLPLSPARN